MKDPIIQLTVQSLGDDTKFLRLATLTMFLHSLVFTYLIIYYGRFYIKSERVDEIVESLISSVDLTGPTLIAIILLGIIIAFGYWLMPAVGESAMIIYQDEGRRQGTLSITKGIGKFFQMFEFLSATGAFQFGALLLIVARFHVFGYLNNPLIYGLLFVWIVMTLFVACFFSYAKYAIVLHDLGFIEAMKYSTQLTLRHAKITFKYVLLTGLLSVRMIINIILLIGIPLGIVRLGVQFGLDSVATLKRVFLTVVLGLVVFVTYVEGIIEAFFITCRQHVWNEVQRREQGVYDDTVNSLDPPEPVE